MFKADSLQGVAGSGQDTSADLRKGFRRENLLLVLILASGAGLRLYGLNWDGGQWLHPDERQIYFVTAGLDWPDSLSEALSPDSPLNPRFFAYGSFPFYVLDFVATLLGPFVPALRNPDNLHLAGRPLALLFDLGTVYLTYRLARTLWPPPCLGDRSGERGDGRLPSLLTAALTSLAVLHVQLAHFYTADTLLVFFVMLTLSQAAHVARGDGLRQVTLGIALGLALATKISAALLIVVVLVAYSIQGKISEPESPFPRVPYLEVLQRTVPVLALATVVFVFTQPYALLDWRTFLDHTIRESQIAWGRLDVPYTRQYAGTLPYLTSIWQTATWGMGLPLGLVAWGGLLAALIRWLRQGAWSDTLLLAWGGLYLAITGTFYARYLRYMLPLVPILCLLAVWSLASLRRRRLRFLGTVTLGIVSCIYAVAFARIYAEPHSWITASEWIYREVSPGSSLAVEEWDTPLPLGLDLDGHPQRIEEYDVRTLPLYDEPDDLAKWEVLAADLAASDYLILASRRLYGSIPRLPDRYPMATRYYDRLLAGELGFDLVAEFTRGPAWLNPRLPPLPDAAPGLLRPDESFVVYDHPRVLILQNVEQLPAEALLKRLE